MPIATLPVNDFGLPLPLDTDVSVLGIPFCIQNGVPATTYFASEGTALDAPIVATPFFIKNAVATPPSPVLTLKSDNDSSLYGGVTEFS